jgi:phosphoglycerol transferase MdoB-like AlkP superfamily enzyme
MKRSITIFLSFWAVLLALMLLQKPLFMMFQSSYTWSELALLPTIMANGLTMDLSMSAYLMAPIALWLIAAVWVRNKGMLSLLKGYFWFVAAVYAMIYVADFVLYPYWKFRLDATPLFYLSTSFKDAMASVSWLYVLGGVVVTVLLAAVVYKILALVAKCYFKDYSRIRTRRPYATTLITLLLTAFLIVPVRGGVTVSTMSPGRAYFSTDMRLNHAAVNPIFNFIYSVAHADNLASQFNFYSDKKAADYLASLDVATPVDSVTAGVHLKVESPDVYLIILESFSAHLMPSLGGEPIAMCLDSIAREGVLFTDFYAESFRTDRGLATILSGYPALPTTSVFKFSNKFGKLPSLSSQLKAEGYHNTYYYGGDINFVNQGAYLIATGFDKIVKDADFAVSKRLSKWGVHDDEVFARAAAEPMRSPEFRVIQTSSSHEPFEVPYHKLSNARANAFAYADSCLGHYIRTLKASKAWSKALVVIVPDHWGAYPENLTDPLQRQHVPLVLTGGALAGVPAQVAHTGSQSAIAPTILWLLGIKPHGFVNQRNLLDTSTQGVAWMAVPEWYGLKIGDSFTQVITNTGETAVGNEVGERQAKSFIQRIYKDLNDR